MHETAWPLVKLILGLRNTWRLGLMLAIMLFSQAPGNCAGRKEFCSG